MDLIRSSDIDSASGINVSKPTVQQAVKGKPPYHTPT